jgi:hypothetical protein
MGLHGLEQGYLLDTIVSILFYFVVVTDLNPYSRDTKQNAYDRSKKNNTCHEELHNLYSSSNIIRMFKSRRMRWSGHVARMGKRNTYRILVGKPEGKGTTRKTKT